MELLQNIAMVNGLLFSAKLSPFCHLALYWNETEKNIEVETEIISQFISLHLHNWRIGLWFLLFLSRYIFCWLFVCRFWFRWLKPFSFNFVPISMITSAKLRKKHDLLWYKINKYMAQLNRIVPNGKKTSTSNSNWIETEQKMIEMTFWCAHSEEMKCLSWVMPYTHIYKRE